MPAAWVSAGVGALGLINSMSSGSGSGSSSGSPTNAFTGPNTEQANNSWSSGMGGLNNVSNNAYNQANPAYLQTLNSQNAMNYSPYLNAANQAGTQYSNMAGTAQGQANTYNAAGNQLYQQAFDPNQTQYNQYANNLGGQVNAGQAARGLGNSPAGGAEYNNAMSNFNTQWNTQQLSNEANAMGAIGQAYTGANTAGNQAAGYMQQAAGVPLAANQYVAGQPATNASQYTNEMGGLGSLYGNVTGQSLPYIMGGQGAQQYNTGYNTQQNTANMNSLLSGMNGLSNQYNTPGSWLNNTFNNPYSAGGTPSGAASLTGADQSAIWNANGSGGGV